MKVVLSIDEIRSVVKSVIEEGGFRAVGIRGPGSIKSRRGSGGASEGEVSSAGARFEYQEIIDQGPAARAEAEKKKWAGKKEDSPAVKSTLADYWKAAGENPKSAIAKNKPWSAAFISYVKKDPFFKSAAHITWKRKAEKNTEKINSNPEKFAGKEMYVALKINDADGGSAVTLNPGDNVWRDREGGPDKSHSDIVINSKEAIGGNLSDTVDITKINHTIVIKKVKVLGPIGSSGTSSSVAQKDDKPASDQPKIVKKGDVKVKDNSDGIPKLASRIRIDGGNAAGSYIQVKSTGRVYKRAEKGAPEINGARPTFTLVDNQKEILKIMA